MTKKYYIKIGKKSDNAESPGKLMAENALNLKG